ncbi:MAG: DUF1844 domain-containing protein [Candidatus Omnitrophica bacterium]|nr:DUF1844 domain-containing protein [Candidatus Omnitrophota bacterium]
MSDAGDTLRKRVDEEWKARIEQEARRAGQAGAPAGETQPTRAAPPKRRAEPHPQFEMLVSSLSMQALMAMGEIPDPATGAAEPQFDQAQSLIDLLGMLEEKTRGNLTDEEARLLGDTLYQLRLRFVEKTQQRGTET